MNPESRFGHETANNTPDSPQRESEPNKELDVQLQLFLNKETIRLSTLISSELRINASPSIPPDQVPTLVGDRTSEISRLIEQDILLSHYADKLRECIRAAEAVKTRDYSVVLQYLEIELSTVDQDDARSASDIREIHRLELSLVRNLYGHRSEEPVIDHARQLFTKPPDLQLQGESDQQAVNSALLSLEAGDGRRLIRLIEYVLYLIAQGRRYIETGQLYGNSAEGRGKRKLQIEQGLCAGQDIDKFSSELRRVWADLNR